MGNGACMSVINEMVGQTRDWVVGHRLHDLPTPKLTPMLAAKWLVDEWAPADRDNEQSATRPIDRLPSAAA